MDRIFGVPTLTISKDRFVPRLHKRPTQEGVTGLTSISFKNWFVSSESCYHPWSFTVHRALHLLPSLYFIVHRITCVTTEESQDGRRKGPTKIESVADRKDFERE